MEPKSYKKNKKNVNIIVFFKVFEDISKTHQYSSHGPKSEPESYKKIKKSYYKHFFKVFETSRDPEAGFLQNKKKEMISKPSLIKKYD